MTPGPKPERDRLEQAEVAHLATVRPDGRPHVVVVTFALAEDLVVTAVDHKPKRTRDLQRLRNIAAHPHVSLLVDHYEEDWSQLWWTRLDGRAEIVNDEPRRTHLLAALVTKYAAYRSRPPEGPVIAITVDEQVSWSAESDRE